MSTILAYFGPGQPLYLAFFTLMIVFFAYFYTFNVSFKPDDVAENLKIKMVLSLELGQVKKLPNIWNMF